MQSLPRQTAEVTGNFTRAEIHAVLTPRPTNTPSRHRARKISRDHQAETAIFAELGWSAASRTIAALLIAMGDGAGEIESSDHEVAERHSKGRRKIDPQSAERQIRRMRGALHEDQKATGLYVVGIREGSQIQTPEGPRRTQSKYHVGRLVNLIATLAANPPRVLSHDRRRRAEAWQRAAAELIHDMAFDEGWDVSPIPGRKKKKLSVEERIKRAIANAAGHAYGVWDLTPGETNEQRLDSLTSEIRNAIKERVSVRPLELEEGEDTEATTGAPPEAPPPVWSSTFAAGGH